MAALDQNRVIGRSNDVKSAAESNSLYLFQVTTNFHRIAEDCRALVGCLGLQDDDEFEFKDSYRLRLSKDFDLDIPVSERNLSTYSATKGHLVVFCLM